MRIHQILLFIGVSCCSLDGFGQESYSMRYKCFQTFQAQPGTKPTGANNGYWSKSKPTDNRVDFNVGINKNIEITQAGRKLTFVRIGEPFQSETESGMKYQVIRTRCAGTEYIFQYFENYNFRMMFTDNKDIIEYGCVQPFDQDAGVGSLNYKINVKRTYFYNRSDLKYRSSAFLIYGQVVEALADENGFIFVTYINGNGVKTSGWLLKSDLNRY